MDNYVGEIRLFAGNYAPQGWRFCDGTLLSIADYENQMLYSLLGTAYGGDGVSTFKLPDLRGRVPVSKGVSSASGVSYPLGMMFGAETVTLSQNQLPQHTRALQVSTVQGDANTASNNLLAVGSNNGYKAFDSANMVSLNAQAVEAAYGGGGAHDNMMPFICLNYIIALAGIYPTQN